MLFFKYTSVFWRAKIKVARIQEYAAPILDKGLRGLDASDLPQVGSHRLMLTDASHQDNYVELFLKFLVLKRTLGEVKFDVQASPDQR